MERDALSLVFGDPGSGKTFISLGIAACVATGINWYGKAVKKGCVFYVAGEGFNGISRRLRAWCEYHGTCLDNAPLFISNQPARFLDKDNVLEVQKEIIHISTVYGTPELVIVDTLARNFGSGNENNTQDMNLFIANLDKYIRVPFRCSVMVIHHTGHSEKYRPRGAYALTGAVDAEYLIEKDKEIITLSATKMKDAELPSPISFRLNSIGLRFLDQKQNEVSSAVLVPVDYISPNLELIRELMPKSGLNQTTLILLFKKHLEISTKKAKQLVEKGIDRYWKLEGGQNNANIYKPFFGFSNPYT